MAADSPTSGSTDSDAMDHTLRITRAWIELRRGARAAALRDYYFGLTDRLEQGQMDALDLLVRRERTMRGLADRMHIDPSSATRVVQRLVKDGLAERFASPDDGRIVMVRITSEGRRRREPVATRRAKAMGQIIGSFEPDERAQLADLLERLNEAIGHVVDELHAETE